MMKRIVFVLIWMISLRAFSQSEFIIDKISLEISSTDTSAKPKKYVALVSEIVTGGSGETSLNVKTLFNSYSVMPRFTPAYEGGGGLWFIRSDAHEFIPDRTAISWGLIFQNPGGGNYINGLFRFELAADSLIWIGETELNAPGGIDRGDEVTRLYYTMITIETFPSVLGDTTIGYETTYP